jgi:ABC-type lipoprotein export system ATPase subunit
MAILGVSGSGKSTLLHICSTLLKPNNGEVILCDHNIYHDNDDARLKLRRYDVGIIFQSHYLFKGFFANENIELASFISDKTIDKGILERLGIADFMHYRVGDLSGGHAFARRRNLSFQGGGFHAGARGGRRNSACGARRYDHDDRPQRDVQLAQ